MYFKTLIYTRILMVLQGDILSVLMIGRVLVLAQVLSEWGAFGADRAGVLSCCPI